MAISWAKTLSWTMSAGSMAAAISIESDITPATMDSDRSVSFEFMTAPFTPSFIMVICGAKSNFCAG
jgi:hypothetical protein